MIEISIAVIAAAFVILVIYLIIVLLAARRTLNALTETLESSTRKLDALDSFSLALSRVGDKALELSDSIEERVAFDESEDRPKGRYKNLLEWLTVGLGLWVASKKRRR